MVKINVLGILLRVVFRIASDLVVQGSQWYWFSSLSRSVANELVIRPSKVVASLPHGKDRKRNGSSLVEAVSHVSQTMVTS